MAYDTSEYFAQQKEKKKKRTKKDKKQELDNLKKEVEMVSPSSHFQFYSRWNTVHHAVHLTQMDTFLSSA